MKIETYDSEQIQNDVEKTTQTSDDNQINADVHDEFRISVRKLEMPVRPRGVLAE